jgi:hypothetical protein
MKTTSYAGGFYHAGVACKEYSTARFPIFTPYAILSFPRKRESRSGFRIWIPGQARDDKKRRLLISAFWFKFHWAVKSIFTCFISIVFIRELRIKRTRPAKRGGLSGN